MDLRAVTKGGAEVALGDSLVDKFGARLRGELLRSGDAAYDEARKVWNGMIDRRPSLIVRAASVADAINSVNFARENDLLLAVRGGGHNVAGTGTVDGGLVIDLSSMKGVTVDPERRTARVEGGVTIGELDRKTQAFGLATPMGVVSETGIAGLTLGGGLGWLRRKHGLSSDNLLSVDIVTADGTFLTASEEKNRDLFWGIQGGGGNFGVVTCFEYRLHPVGPEVMFAFVFYPGERAGEVLRSLEAYMQGAPDEVSPVAVLGRIPHDETFPERWRGEQYVAVLAMYAGELEEGERVLALLRDLGEPIVDLSGPMPYVEAQKVLDEDYPNGRRYYWKSTNVGGLDDGVIDGLVAHAEAAPSDHSTIDVWYQGGAMGRVGAAATAFGDRSAPILLGIEANWEAPADDEANVAWARKVVSDMRRFSDGGAYLNFPGFMEEGQKLMRDAYGKNYDRLVQLKNRYDPANVFRLNQNIKPGV
ncbi:MAG TPA: FAD-binding oxidoreductase [Rubrobacteraceae bacterium]|nr:FAD-binding oxidoreductase [Rubrobacteraceae bacterium]